MEEIRLYTIARMSEELGIPESTLRRYTKQFSEFIPSVGRGRKRRFKPETKEILLHIAQLFSQGLETGEVHAHLEQHYTRTIDAPVPIDQGNRHALVGDQAVHLTQALEKHSEAIIAQTAVTQETLELLRQQSDLNQTMLAALASLPNAVADEVRKQTLLSRMKRILRIDNNQEEEHINSITARGNF
ncbi:MAG: MerR family transcriptional regulator [Limnochordia bacterium]